MADEPLRIPDRSYHELRVIAEDFLAQHHPEKTIPVPVEEIIEFRLGLNIIPMPGLRRFFDIDGYVSKSLHDISVDQYIQESEDLTTTGTSLPTNCHTSSSTLKSSPNLSLIPSKPGRPRFLGSPRRKDRSTMVRRTNSAPSSSSRLIGWCRTSKTSSKRFQQKGLTLDQVAATERGRIIVENHLARCFDVPRFVITDRMNRGRLWPR